MTKYKNGKLEIDLHGLLDSIPADDLAEFFESISTNERVIGHVTEQILNKWTENGYSGGYFVTASSCPYYGLDKAWREVAKRSNEVAKREIERLEKALAIKTKEYSDLLADHLSRSQSSNGSFL